MLYTWNQYNVTHQFYPKTKIKALRGSMTFTHVPKAANSTGNKALFIPQPMYEKTQPVRQSCKLRHHRRKLWELCCMEAASLSREPKGGEGIQKWPRWNPGQVFKLHKKQYPFSVLYKSHSEPNATATPEIALTRVHSLPYNTQFKQLCRRGGGLTILPEKTKTQRGQIKGGRLHSEEVTDLGFMSLSAWLQGLCSSLPL